MKKKPAPINGMILARRAVRLFNSDMVSLHTNKFNRRAWLRSIKMLGEHWIGLPTAIARLP